MTETTNLNEVIERSSFLVSRLASDELNGDDAKLSPSAPNEIACRCDQDQIVGADYRVLGYCLL